MYAKLALRYITVSTGTRKPFRNVAYALTPPRTTLTEYRKPQQVRCIKTIASQDAESGLGMKDSSKTPHSWTFTPSTLDPSRLTRNDIVDLSGLRRCVLRDAPSSGNRRLLVRIAYKALGTATVLLPFPAGTSGVFYFHDRRSVHPVAGGLRFRVLPAASIQGTESPLELFAKGHDLLDYTGFAPWQISLLSAMYRKRSIYSLLKKGGCITDEAEEEVERLRSEGKAVCGINSQIVERFTDPFIIDLSLSEERVVFLANEGIVPHRFSVRNITRMQGLDPHWEQRSNYSGTVLVRFEMIEHQGKQRVVLRVLRFLKPPNPGDPITQEEGELLKKWDPVKKLEQVWMASSGSKWMTPSNLKLLEETYLTKTTA
ncbi:hypothetical protein NMY22_g2331 [Coprinellus aureogranulatus]|nr:hypothetical protein NMY22_g2331 [Coprinellus aureogranulatus]